MSPQSRINGMPDSVSFDQESCIKPSELYRELSLMGKPRCIRALHLSKAPYAHSWSASPDHGAELRGTLEIVDLNDCPQFTALSYVWGSGSLGDHFITCNNSRIPITTNCHQALTAIRETEGNACIWVDAICINQNDDVEKTFQIPLMQEIYTWATTVFIWLGPSTPEKSSAMQALSQMATKRVYNGPIPWHEGKEVTERDRHTLWGWWKYFYLPLTFLYKQFDEVPNRDLGALLNTDWLQRAWTFQEIALASAPVILCGNQKLYWKDMFKSFEFIADFSMASDEHDGHNNMGKHAKRLTDSNEFPEWESLLRVWISMSRPTTWNGKTYRILPPTISDKSSCSVFQYVAAFDKKTIKKSAIFTWYLVTFGLVLVCVLSCGITLIKNISRTHPGAYGFFIALAVITAVAAFFIIFTHYVSPGDHSDEDYYNQTLEIDRTQIVGLMRAIRHRNASFPKDRVFALDGVLRQLGCTPPAPDHSKSVGQLYRELTTTLISWDPAFVNMLIDSGTPVDDTPSWVPDFHTIQQRAWLPLSCAYDFLDKDMWPKGELDVQIHGNMMMLDGAYQGSLSSVMTSFPRIEKDDGRPAPGMVDRTFHVASLLCHWFAALRKRKYVTAEYGSLAESTYAVFYPEKKSRSRYWKEFKMLYHTLSDDVHFAYKNGADKFTAMEAALVEVMRKPAQVAFIRRLSNRLSGKRGLFISEGGFFGSVPEHARMDDSIFVLRGVSVPMILRSDENAPGCYRVIGPAWIPALQDLRRKSLEAKNLDWEIVTLL